MTVPTPIRHQDKSRDLKQHPSSSAWAITCFSQSPSLPLGPKPGLGQRNGGTKKLHCHLRNLRGEDPALASLLPSAKYVNRVNGKQKCSLSGSLSCSSGLEQKEYRGTQGSLFFLFVPHHLLSILGWSRGASLPVPMSLGLYLSFISTAASIPRVLSGDLVRGQSPLSPT